MMVHVTTPRFPTRQTTQSDHETALISALHASMIGNSASTSLEEIANFYVALKSKPLAILAGPAHSGKIALVQCLAQSLGKRDDLCVQMITGHPWWAERSADLAVHTGLHIRFSTEKILSLIEEAVQPANARHVFVACFTRISPAELLTFFTEVAFQLRSGQIIRLGDTHLSEPIPFPANLRIIGTMDTHSFDWWDADLLQSTTVIQWPRASVLPDHMSDLGIPLEAREFLQSCIRCRDSAYRKIFPVLKRQRQPLYALMQLEAILKRYVTSLDDTQDEVMIYLANSWSRLGNGLFHPSPDRNLAIALDLAMAQYLLPRAVDAIRNLETLHKRLKNILANRFLRSTAFLTTLAAQD